MATCRECYRMGYPLRNGICKGCRGAEVVTATVNVDREKEWRQHTKVTYKDPKPLLGETYAQKEYLRTHYPFRRPPQSVPCYLGHAQRFQN